MHGLAYSSIKPLDKPSRVHKKGLGFFMSSNTFSKTFKRTEAQKSHVSSLQWVAMLIVVLVVAFSDVMFIKLMWNHFPEGFMRVLAVGGAIATGLSIITLLIGKLIWFRPGAQMNWAYVFMAVEIAVSVLNVLAACGVQGMDTWMMMSPATPFVCLIGWTFIMVHDSATKQRHEDMDMEDEVLRSERAFIKMQHEARMEINHRALEYNKQYMIEALENPQHQRSIQLGADRSTANAIQQLTGRYVPHQIAASSVVDADPPKRIEAPAVAAHRPQIVDPHKVKPQVDSERKPLEEKKGLRGWIDKNVFKTDDDSRNGELAPPVQYDDTSAVWEKKDGKWAEAGKQQEDQGEKIKQPSLPVNPARWTKLHWMQAKEMLPEDEYNDLFDMYLGDSPSEEQVREENENPQ